jgi:hypothetical protein
MLCEADQQTIFSHSSSGLDHDSSMTSYEADSSVFFGVITSPEKRAEARLESQFEDKENDDNNIPGQNGKGKARRKSTRTKKDKGRRDTVVIPLKKNILGSTSMMNLKTTSLISNVDQGTLNILSIGIVVHSH